MPQLVILRDGERAFVVRRHLAGPPAAVCAAHVEPGFMQQWMLGPPGWTMPACVSEARPGGRLRCEWTDGRGGGFHATGEYLDLDPPHRIVHVERMHLPAPTPDARAETTFAAAAGGTLLTLRMTLPDAAAREAMLATGMAAGMEAGYARLDALLAPAPVPAAPGARFPRLAIAPEGERRALVRRDFAAPRARLWDALTDPARIRAWQWARAHPIIGCTLDLRPGGAFALVWARPEGGRMAVSGRFLVVAPPGLMVRSEVFEEDWTGGATVVTTRLEEAGGGTRMTTTIAFATAAGRDGALATPMAAGLEEGFARLDGLLAGPAAAG